MGKRIAGKGGEMKKKYKYILAGVVVAVFVVAAAVGILKPIAVELETVANGSLETELTVQGTLTPIHSTLLSAGFQGAVREMPHQAGTALKQGEMILRMGYESQAELELSREQYRQQLTSAKQTYENLFGDHGSAPAALAAAQSDYELSRKNYENGRALAAAGSISQIELDVLANQYRDVYKRQPSGSSMAAAGEWLNSDFSRAALTTCRKSVVMRDCFISSSIL